MKRFNIKNVQNVIKENDYLVIVMKNGEKLVADGGEFTASGVVNYLREYDNFIKYDDTKYPLGRKFVVYGIKNNLYNKLVDMA